MGLMCTPIYLLPEQLRFSDRPQNTVKAKAIPHQLHINPSLYCLIKERNVGTNSIAH